MSKNENKVAVFLDRDGTINVEKDYLYKIEDFEFIPGAPEAICRLKEAGYQVVVVTNQSGVGRGYYSLDDVDLLHNYIQERLQNLGTKIDAFYICPHHPQKAKGAFLKDCDCRKGKPGMLLQAAEERGVDLSKSYIIGDKIVDIEAGENAGVTPLLVLTGYGRRESQDISEQRAHQCADIAAAVDYILGAVNPQ